MSAIGNKQIGDELRAVMSGKSASGVSERMLRTCALKVTAWQKLARKYHGPGLSRAELDDFWQEIKDHRTNADLILEITVRSDDWRQASQEVKAFMDELRYEMLAADGAYRDIAGDVPAPPAPADELESEETAGAAGTLAAETRLKKHFKKQLTQEYQLNGRTKLADQLALVLARACQLQAATMGVDPETVLADAQLAAPTQLLAVVSDHLAAATQEETASVAPTPWYGRLFGG